MDFMTQYKNEIVSVCRFFTLPFLAFLISLSSVFLFGRMLGFVYHYRIKNFIAAVTMVGAYILYFYTMELSTPFNEKIWYITLYFSISVIFYVLLGFKFYDSFDHLLDHFFKYEDSEHNMKQKVLNKNKNKKKK